MIIMLEGKTPAQLIADMQKRLGDRAVVVSEQEEIVRRIDKDITAYRQKAIELIKKGESTGDSLRDILIQHLSTWDDVTEKKFRDFQDLLTGKTGQFFLISCTDYQRVRYGPVDRESDYQKFHLVRFGKLLGEKLIYNSDNVGITVPVLRYATAKSYFPTNIGPDHSVVDENIFARSYKLDPPYLATHILDNVTHLVPGHRKQTLDSVVVGDEEVLKWLLEHQGGRELFDTAASAFGKLPAEPFSLKPMGPKDGPLPFDGERLDP